MYKMSIQGKIRAWLGIDDVILAMADIPSLAMFKAMEQKQKERHDAVINLLQAIEKRMINEHIGVQPREFAPPVLDWDTVQAIAMRDIETNPIPKEYQDV